MSTFSSSFGRRRFMQGAGAVATAVGSAGLLAACGNSGGSGSKVALKQWYHQYGEVGTEQAAFRYAKAYTAADVTVEWEAGDGDDGAAQFQSKALE